MEQLETSCGLLSYTLTRKKVKNLNLRIRPSGEVFVSVPFRMPQKMIDSFLLEKAGWIFQHKAKISSSAPALTPMFTKEECLALFTVFSNEIFPLFATILHGQKPVLKVREMKTRWGVCHIQKRVIVLNSRLAEQPIEAIEYVILHEYVHFIYPDHQAGFHAKMAQLMPDYKQRRKLLK